MATTTTNIPTAASGPVSTPTTAARKPRPRKTPEELLLMKLERRGAFEEVELPAVFGLLDGILGGIAPEITARLNADGSRSLVTDRGRVLFTVSADPAALAQHPSLAVPPIHAYRNAALQQHTIEAEFANVVADKIPKANSSLAAVISSLFFRGLWYVAPERHAKLAGAAIRKSNLHQRRLTSTAIGEAYAKNDTLGEGVRRLLDVAPFLVNLYTPDTLRNAVAAGTSATELITQAGGTRALYKLATSAYTVLAPDTVDLISEALAAASAAGSLPAGASQRAWLQELIGVMMRPEPAKGFYHWLATKTAGAASTWRGMPMYFVTLWAAATHGRRDGWNDALDWGKVCLKTGSWLEGQERQAKAIAKAVEARGTGALPVVFPVEMGVGRFRIKQFTTIKELYEAGITLDVCLSYMIDDFAAMAMGGATTYLGIYETHRPKSEKEKLNANGEVITVGKLLSAAEVGLGGGRERRVIQHHGPRNAEPPPAQRLALADYLELNRGSV
jgi:hypothetical protein